MHSNQIDFYKIFFTKAEEIYLLSKKISDYLSVDLSGLKSNGLESPNIYFSGDIVQQSSSLSKEIIKLQQTTILEKKYAHALTLRWLTYRLLQNCKRLEKCDSNGKDFMPVLKKELKKFKKLYSNWILTL